MKEPGKSDTDFGATGRVDLSNAVNRRFILVALQAARRNRWARAVTPWPGRMCILT